MLNLSTKLDQKLKVIAPIHGISIGSEDDKSTWEISFKNEATQEEINAALAFIKAVSIEELKSSGLVPLTITRMQLITALSKMGLITPQEAVEANFVVPAGVLEVINNLPEEQRIPAQIKWLNFTEAYRNDELVLALAAANNMSSEDIDNFFIMAGNI